MNQLNIFVNVFSRNPNAPTRPSSFPEWLQFTENSEQFMKINSFSPEMIETPNKQRLEKVQSQLLEARDAQFLADKPVKDCPY